MFVCVLVFLPGPGCSLILWLEALSAACIWTLLQAYFAAKNNIDDGRSEKETENS